MTWWGVALWGSFGGLAVEMVAFLGAINRHGKLPWQVDGEVSITPFVAAVLVRVGLGCGIATATYQTGQIAGPLGAIMIGAAAPVILEQLARNAGSGQLGQSDAG